VTLGAHLFLCVVPLAQAPEAEVAVFLERFDAACASRRWEEVLPLLASGPANARAATERGLRELLGSAGVVRRASRIQQVRTAPRALGAFVEVGLFLSPPDAKEGGFAKERRLHEFLLLRREGEDLRLVRRLDFAPEGPLPKGGDPAGCAACGWTVSPPRDWFAVPTSRAVSGATESMTFVREDGETTIELQVRQAAKPWDPLTATERDDDRLLREWKDPPGARVLFRRALERKDRFQAAESEIAIPLEGGREGRVRRTYLAAGPILVAFVAHGPAAAIDRIREDFETLCASFEVRETAESPEERARRIREAHLPGASLEGSRFTYRTPSYGLGFEGPKDWEGSLLTAPGPFRVRFECPATHATIDAYALEREPGWASEESVAALFDATEREMKKCGARALSRVVPRAEVTLSGLPDPAYRSDLEWQDEGGDAVRERCVLVPLPDAALFLRLCCAAAAYEKASPNFEALLATLRLER
jgi:hypothetical protein